ncbi:ArsR family transcriptional regulator [Nocardia sp. NPDC050412]
MLREAGALQARERGACRMHSLRRDDLDTHFPEYFDVILGTASEML